MKKNSAASSKSALRPQCGRNLVRSLALAAMIAAFAAPAMRPVAAIELQTAAGLQTFKRATCGYDPRGAEDEWLNHKSNPSRLNRSAATEYAALASAKLESGPRVERVGDIAVIEDDGAIVMPPNKFDLKKSSILFTPEEEGYQITRDGVEFSTEFGNRLTNFIAGEGSGGNSDDGYQNINLADAQFTFFGVTYDSIFVGTNGYVTFNQGDTRYDPSAAVLASELPRIAPLWADLIATGQGGIHYNRLTDRHLITWDSLLHAVYGRKNTFQLALYDDGRIAFVYKKIKSRISLAGISPGKPGIEARPLDFSSPPEDLIAGPAFESFSKQKRLDVPALTRAFYSAHEDLFDTLYLWTDFSFDNGLGLAHSFNVRNDIEGIGLSLFDRGAVYGSDSRLSTIITMGNIARDWPSDPEAHHVGLNSALSIVCHEQGHRWLVYVRFGNRRDVEEDLLGRDRSHWSFLAETRTNSQGSFSSLMEGNSWRENGNGTFTTVESAVNHFSDLDQYLMGLRSAGEVEDIAYMDVDSDLKDFLRERSPVNGFTLSAVRKLVSVDQIIKREGPRVPAAEDAPKDFRIAFVLLTERGTAASNATINKMDSYRDSLVRYFSIATGRRGSLNSSLADVE